MEASRPSAEQEATLTGDALEAAQAIASAALEAELVGREFRMDPMDRHNTERNK